MYCRATLFDAAIDGRKSVWKSSVERRAEVDRADSIESRNRPPVLFRRRSCGQKRLIYRTDREFTNGYWIIPMEIWYSARSARSSSPRAARSSRTLREWFPWRVVRAPSAPVGQLYHYPGKFSFFFSGPLPSLLHDPLIFATPRV